MKYLTAVILIISLFTFQFTELLIFMSFKINQDYIAKNLCIEKDVEGSTCQGCCQLKKRMNEQQESKQALPPISSEKQNIDFITISEELCTCYFPESEDLVPLEIKPYFICVSDQIFHPPKV